MRGKKLNFCIYNDSFYDVFTEKCCLKIDFVQSSILNSSFKII